MELPEDTVADLVRRLRRVEGQVRGVQQMLQERRDCREIVTQLTAANKALEQAGFVLVAAGLTWCLADPERSAAEGYDLADVQKMFTKLA
ncbi:MAG: metal-sensitive transcriptional regulator [Ilumatobacteraceae bacterium]|jgi:DNA-binding FrmR family transcriptional regulator